MQKLHKVSSRRGAPSSINRRLKNMSNDCVIKELGQKLDKFMCMQGGDDDTSYAKNSEAPASAITQSRPFLYEAIHSMKLFQKASSSSKDIEEGGDDEENDDYLCLSLADLGCATGHNTINTMSMVVDLLKERYVKERGFEPEFEVFFSDLPSNDFNSLFRSMAVLYDEDEKTSDIASQQFYAGGVPGSFYHRLFPKRKLHLVVCFSALHWLSEIPEEVEDKRSGAWNEGRAWIDGAKKEVVDAYAKQSEKDIDDFLRFRKEEMIKGGLLFMLMAGREDSSHPENQLSDHDTRAKHPLTTSMDNAWQDLINEGMIDENARDKFNVPVYMRSTQEVEKAMEKCGGFKIKRIEYHKIEEYSKEKQEEWIKDPVSYGRARANLVRATLTPIVESHIGVELAHELFDRYEKRASADISLLQKACFYGVIVVSAFRI